MTEPQPQDIEGNTLPVRTISYKNARRVFGLSEQTFRRIGGQSVLTKLIDLPFPDIDRAFVEPEGGSISFEVKPMLSALRRASVFLGKYQDAVWIDAEIGKLTVKAESGDKPGTFQEVVGAYDGAPAHLAYNARRLSSALSRAGVKRSTIHYSDRDGPSFIEVGRENVRCVIMPTKRARFVSSETAA
jgi:DNA polymerase III sliding clamp (beta) subunit (PCNA family)